jgi:UDP-glucose 4-epimerase
MTPGRSALTGSRVLITGGAGFVGSHIADQVLHAGAVEVLVVDNLVRGRRENLQEAQRRGAVRLIEGSICDRDLVGACMRGVDYVFHQAALRITHCAEAPREAHAVMYDGTFNVLEAAVAAGVKKVVAASSASVYGEPRYLPIDEDHPYDNRTLYGAAKIANEHLLRSFREMYGLPYVALRYFNVYGPRMDIHGVYTEVIVRWMERIEGGQPPLIFGDGAQSMDFVYIGDVARANRLALAANASDDVFNVASGIQTTLDELAVAVCAAMGRPDLRPEYREERAVNPVRHRLGATERARTRLGFSAQVGLAEGLAELAAWRRATLAATGIVVA